MDSLRKIFGAILVGAAIQLATPGPSIRGTAIALLAHWAVLVLFPSPLPKPIDTQPGETL